MLDSLVLHFDTLFQHWLGRAQLQREALVFLLQAIDAVGVLQGQQHLLGLPRLEQILVDTGLVDAGDDVFCVGIAREDDAYRIWPLTAHRLQELDAGSTRHALIAEDDLHPSQRPFALKNQLRLLGPRSGEDFEILLQRAAQRFLRAQLVVDNEHGRQFQLVRCAHCGTSPSGFQPRSRCLARCRGVHDCGDFCTKWKRATW